MAIYHKTPQDGNRITPREEEIPPILPPQPDNIAGSLTGNNKIQEVGQNLWEGEAFAEQRALKRQVGASPVPPPGDGIQQEYGGMFMQPFAQSGRPYVVNKEKTGTSKDTLYLPKNTYISKSGLAEDSDIDNAARKAAAEGIYNYTGGNKNFNFEYLENKGKVKYEK